MKKYLGYILPVSNKLGRQLEVGNFTSIQNTNFHTHKI